MANSPAINRNFSCHSQGLQWLVRFFPWEQAQGEETGSPRPTNPYSATVPMSLICVSMCGLDNCLASVSSIGKCLMIPTAFSFVSLEQRNEKKKKKETLSLPQLLMPWLLACSKWLRAYRHRNQVHILTIFHSGRINNSHTVWANNWESFRHKIILF